MGKRKRNFKEFAVAEIKRRTTKVAAWKKDLEVCKKRSKAKRLKASIARYEKSLESFAKVDS